MKKVLSIALVFITVISYGQVNIQWLQDTEGISIAVDGSDNVYTVYYEYNPAGDIYLTKRNSDGVFIWQEKFDQTDNTKWEKATWVATDNLGNILVSGTLMSGYSNPVEAASIIMKFDSAGNLIWRNVYESSFDGSYTKKCLVDINNNIYVLGMGSGTSGYVTKVKKFTPDGIAIWTYYDANGIGAPINFKFTPDDAIVLTGRAIFGSINGYAKIDLNGNHIWSYPGVPSLTIGDAEGDDFGNTYLVHGEYVTNGGTELKKISPTGSLIWSNVYNLAGFRVEVGSDNQPVVCGFPNPNSFGSSFIKVDGNGNIVWTNPDADSTFALMLHARLIMDQHDNIYLAAGTLTEMAVCKVNSDGTSAWTVTLPGSYANDITLGSDNDVYVVGGNTARINQTIVSVVNEDGIAPEGYTLKQNYPNPFNPVTNIRFRIADFGFVSLKIYDILGNEVATLVNEEKPAGNYEVNFNASSLSSGTYFYKLQAGSFIETKKMILLK
ncbi:MAG TPA: T9SS type A sorting domain-containing protein [Ignavibacteriaceae bacterium]|nr:T9SS type A sorting domain-containing protein [Ignavibacteriaceae bacterium]